MEIVEFIKDMSEEHFQMMKGKKFISIVIDGESLSPCHFCYNKCSDLEAVYALTKAISMIVNKDGDHLE